MKKLTHIVYYKYQQRSLQRRVLTRNSSNSRLTSLKYFYIVAIASGSDNNHVSLRHSPRHFPEGNLSDHYPSSAAVVGAAAVTLLAAAAAGLLSMLLPPPSFAVAAATGTTHCFISAIDALPSCYMWVVCCLHITSVLSTERHHLNTHCSSHSSKRDTIMWSQTV